MSAHEEKGFVSYRGQMNGGAPIGCIECEGNGRPGETMIYQGIELSKEPFNFGDYSCRVPFDVWKCRFGHRHTDGY